MLIEHDILKVVAGHLSEQPFLFSDGKPAPPELADNPEGSLVKIFSKTLCLEIASDLNRLDKELDKHLENAAELGIKVNLRRRKDMLIKLFNLLLAIRPITYGELNAKIAFKGEQLEKLLELEQQCIELGIADCESDSDGVSVFSLMATITDILCDDRLAFKLSSPSENNDPSDPNGLEIIGVTWLSECRPRDIDENQAIRRCRVCGCCDYQACMTEDGPCHWVEPDLCSGCAGKEGDR